LYETYLCVVAAAVRERDGGLSDAKVGAAVTSVEVGQPGAGAGVADRRGDIVERVGEELRLHAAAADLDRHVDVLRVVGQVVDVGGKAHAAVQAKDVPRRGKAR